MNRTYSCVPTARVACAILALLATGSSVVFIDQLARNGGPAQHAYAARPVVVAVTLPEPLWLNAL